MWDLRGPGLESVSPALAVGFLTTVPPGKPVIFIFIFFIMLLPISFFLVSAFVAYISEMILL